MVLLGFSPSHGPKAWILVMNTKKKKNFTDLIDYSSGASGCGMGMLRAGLKSAVIIER